MRYEKYAADKIALLGLFIVALLAARLITFSRSSIVLSEPIKLTHTGLSVSMPAGNGWQSEKRWKYQENGFTLRSVFIPHTANPTALISCRYILTGTNEAADTRFKQKASDAGAGVAKIGQTKIDPLIIDWAHIKKQKTLLQMFFGTVKLPGHRQLEIEVHQTTGDTDLAEQIFKRVAESLKFKDNQLLEAGSEVVAKIKNEGLDSFFDNQSKQAFFLIKDARNRTIGFTMDLFIKSGWVPTSQSNARWEPGQDAQLNIQAASSFYIRGRLAREQVTLLQSDNRFDEFVWKNETSLSGSRSGTKVTLNKAGVMTVKKFGWDPKRNKVRLGTRPQTEDKKYQLSSAAIPEIFLELTYSQMLDSNHKKIVVDTIEANGTITPRLISRIYVPLPAANRGEEKAAYVLRVEFLGGQGFSEQVYLDNQKQISRISLQHESTYILERTSLENILREFPERADYILKNSNLLEQN